jgi:hypothetical protein
MGGKSKGYCPINMPVGKKRPFPPEILNDPLITATQFYQPKQVTAGEAG